MSFSPGIQYNEEDSFGLLDTDFMQSIDDAMSTISTAPCTINSPFTEPSRILFDNSFEECGTPPLSNMSFDLSPFSQMMDDNMEIFDSPIPDVSDVSYIITTPIIETKISKKASTKNTTIRKKKKPKTRKRRRVPAKKKEITKYVLPVVIVDRVTIAHVIQTALEIQNKDHKPYMNSKRRRKTRFGAQPSKLSWLITHFIDSMQKGMCLNTREHGWRQCPAMHIIYMALNNDNTNILCTEPRRIINNAMSKEDVQHQTVLYDLVLINKKFKIHKSGTIVRPMTLTKARTIHGITSDNWEAMRIVRFDFQGNVSFCLALSQLRLYIESFLENYGNLLHGYDKYYCYPAIQTFPPVPSILK